MTPQTRTIHGIAALGILALAAGCTTGDSFHKLDADRSGSVSPAEFDAHMKQEVFARVDANSDGKVTLEEWQAFNPKVDSKRFRKADSNGDGSISRKEADAEFDREGSLPKLFKLIDTDGNGSLSQAEISAFQTKVRQQPGGSPSEKITNATQQP
ncbi:MAG: EF-hand domain-containing protein [Akkermansiaceae bacterium]|jgi:Ca2+-binding EF-hand superfamily protein|nr:EF-hand domain-containing protein [Akkermansiaceae bacterium]MCU0777235.1 EF-hand domain-containing protein [Akkermansiaceae bacterium]